jgi:ABC-type glycerol-3-phosphate transport system permease component
MDKKRKRTYSFSVSTRKKLVTYIILFVGAFISLIPFVWMVSTSLMSLGEALGTAFFPSSLNFQNYAEAWQTGAILAVFPQQHPDHPDHPVWRGDLQRVCRLCLCPDGISWA